MTKRQKDFYDYHFIDVPYAWKEIVLPKEIE